jgi:hypothetical protein
MVNKTPFEIRTELLTQAQSILFEKTMNVRQRLENDWNCQRDIWFTKAANGEELPQPPYPYMPVVTTEEIISEAKKLNDFVSNG